MCASGPVPAVVRGRAGAVRAGRSRSAAGFSASAERRSFGIGPPRAGGVPGRCRPTRPNGFHRVAGPPVRPPGAPAGTGSGRGTYSR
ncbi:hypothetical protein GZL_05809 [Streptomyces sp. 769]|nr:hypothetical protein GZL_05809 [Streptomyces sp. 769]